MHDGVSNHQPHECLFNHLFRRKSKKTSKLRVIGLFVGNSPVTGEFHAQRASDAENVSIWWRHHANAHRHTHKHTQSVVLASFSTPWLNSCDWYNYIIIISIVRKHTEGETIWPSLCGGHFQNHFLKWKLLYFIQIALKFVGFTYE